MKKLIFFIIIVPICVLSQTVNEKSIFKFDNLQNVQAYSLKFDEKTGTYLYSDYDTTTKKSILYSNKGNSSTYDFVDYYDAVIYTDGNYYSTADNNITDTTYEYFIIKNGKEIAKYDYINTFWKEKNGVIYYQCKEGDKSYFSSLELSTGNISKGKAYDDILLCSFPQAPREEEQEGEIGFTTDGKPYYIAKLNNEAFLVIGTEEQKHYSDIDAYSFKTDPSGNFCYTAKDKGVFYNAGNTFVVQGNKEYKKFDYINSPFIFDESGTVIYVGSDSVDSASPQRLMIGDKEASKTYDGGLYNVQYSPDKKLYYVASEKKKKSEDYVSFVVYDGKEGKKYQSVGIIKATPGELLYIANKSDNEQVIVRGNKELNAEYPTILDVSVLPNGKFVYVGGSYGDYDKKTYDKFYVQLGEDELGPYDDVMPINYETNDYVMGDASGNNVYVVNKLINRKDYIYKQNLYYNTKNIGEFDNIENISLYKGKPLYTASILTDKVNYYYKYKIYYNGKEISPEYDSIDGFKLDEPTGTITFTGTRGKEFFKVEIKM